MDNTGSHPGVDLGDSRTKDASPTLEFTVFRKRCEKNERQRKKQKKSPILNFCTCMNQNTRIIRRSSNTADINQLRTIPQSTEKALFPFSFETSKG
jgi:hypothetical protein